MPSLKHILKTKSHRSWSINKKFNLIIAIAKKLQEKYTNKNQIYKYLRPGICQIRETSNDQFDVTISENPKFKKESLLFAAPEVLYRHPTLASDVFSLAHLIHFILDHKAYSAYEERIDAILANQFIIKDARFLSPHRSLLTDGYTDLIKILVNRCMLINQKDKNDSQETNDYKDTIKNALPEALHTATQEDLFNRINNNFTSILLNALYPPTFGSSTTSRNEDTDKQWSHIFETLVEARDFFPKDVQEEFIELESDNDDADNFFTTLAAFNNQKGAHVNLNWDTKSFENNESEEESIIYGILDKMRDADYTTRPELNDVITIFQAINLLDKIDRLFDNSSEKKQHHLNAFKLYIEGIINAIEEKWDTPQNSSLSHMGISFWGQLKHMTPQIKMEAIHDYLQTNKITPEMRKLFNDGKLGGIIKKTCPDLLRTNNGGESLDNSMSELHSTMAKIGSWLGGPPSF